MATYSFQKDGKTYLSPHFQVKEFRCKDGSDAIIINPQLINVLEALFIKLNAKAINITSGYRTDGWSEKIGGYAGDQHTQGNAVDITAKRQDGSLFTSKEITLALEEMAHMGGIGLINKTNSVHIDVRGRKCWFDETNHEKTVNSWSEYWGVSQVKPAPIKMNTYKLTCLWINVRNGRNGSKAFRLYRGQSFNIYEEVNGWLRIDNSNRWIKPGIYYKKIS